MANFKMELPNDLIKQLTALESNAEDMISDMASVGAKVAFNNIKSNVPDSFKKSNIMKCLKITKVYKTPSDDGINSKVAFYGYFKNHNRVKTPAPLVANVFEFGSTKVKKKPFIRKSFNKKQIEQAMQKVQDKYIKED